MTGPGHIGISERSIDVRSRLVEALKLDLVGPWPGHPFAIEQIPGWVRPSNWYLTGFLIPSGSPPEKSSDADEDEDLGAIPVSEGLAEESNEDRKAAKKGFFRVWPSCWTNHREFDTTGCGSVARMGGGAVAKMVIEVPDEFIEVGKSDGRTFGAAAAGLQNGSAAGRPWRHPLHRVDQHILNVMS